MTLICMISHFWIWSFSKFLCISFSVQVGLCYCFLWSRDISWLRQLGLFWIVLKITPKSALLPFTILYELYIFYAAELWFGFLVFSKKVRLVMWDIFSISQYVDWKAVNFGFRKLHNQNLPFCSWQHYFDLVSFTLHMYTTLRTSLPYRTSVLNYVDTVISSSITLSYGFKSLDLLSSRSYLDETTLLTKIS